MDDSTCQHCDAELDGDRKWELLDGQARVYGYSCEDCAEGAFDRYMESMVE